MKIITLGTSHGDHTYCRFNSSTLLEFGEDRYLIDAGVPVDALLFRRKVDFNDLMAVFVTHMHGDHAAGIPNLIKYIEKMDEKGKRQGNPRRRPASFFLPEDQAILPLTQWCQALHLKCPSPLFSLNAVCAGVVYQDQNIIVTAHPTRHLVSHTGQGPISFAYQVQGEGKNLLFTGDLTPDFSDFPQIALEQPFDLIFCEATHYPPQAALPTLERTRTKALVFYHIHDPWHGEGETRLLDYYRSLDYPCRIAHDGDAFEL